MLSQVRGVEAIVLGGSYARGTAHERSDMDIGLYYFEREPFAVADVRRVAARYMDPATFSSVTVGK